MKKEKLYLSTIDPNAAQTAREWGLGLEIAEYCTAWNMDRDFAWADAEVRKSLEGIASCVLHGPFNELFPCAIDPEARALAARRYRQAIALAKKYGAEKVILHGGYNPWIYYPNWYVEQSIVFWKDFLREDPGVEIVLENVLETDSRWLPEIVQGVNDPRLKLCLDVGHVNAYSDVPVMEWVEAWASELSHFHIHNNDGTADQHRALTDGSMPMAQLLHRIGELCPEATITLELPEAAASVQWIMEDRLWN